MNAVSANPYAAPATGRPDDTWWNLWSMGSTLAVGPHRVEARTWHWTGLSTIQVDGVEVHRERNMGWHAQIEVPVGGHQLQIITRWYPIQPVQVRLDDILWVDDLFPQIGWLKAIGALTVLPFVVVFSGSITYDIWRMVQLARTIPLD
jgi:hypothetical protein